MGAGAGQTGGGMQTMPQMGQMPPGVPTQGGISALAAQGAQMDPRLAAIMQAMQQQGGMPGAGMMPPGGVPPGVSPEDFQRITTTGGSINLPGGGTMSSAGGMMPLPPMPGIAAPGGVPVQRPLPVGAGGKGTGMPPPGMVNPPRPMPLPPGLNRPMPMPLPPGSMVNPPRPIGPKPVPQPVRSTPKPVNPRFNQIMPFLR